MTITIELEAQTNLIRSQLTQKYEQILGRMEKQRRDAYVALEQELALAGDSLERCQTDLWQAAPLASSNRHRYTG